MNQRQISFVSMLLNNDSTFIPMSVYAKQLQVSAKTLQRDVEQVAGFLAAFHAELEKKSGVGIRLTVSRERRGQMVNQIAYLSYEGHSLEPQSWEREARRRDMVLNLLLYSDEITSLSSLAYKYYVSKSTVNHDLQVLEERLERFSISLRKTAKGTGLCGEERSIRQALVSVISQILDSGAVSVKNGESAVDVRTLRAGSSGIILDIFRESDISFVNQLMGWVEKNYGYGFDDSEFVAVSLDLLVMIYRLKNGYTLAAVRETGLGDNGLNNGFWLDEIAEEVSVQVSGHYHLALPRSERDAVKRIFALTRLSKAGGEGAADDVFHLFCEDFIDAFSTITNINLRENPVFCENVISHINLMLNRLFHGTPASNPLMELLLKDYRSTLNVCKIICRILAEKFRLPELSIDEISFLMLYILGEIVRQSEHARVLFVTDMSRSVANLMKLRLLQRYPQWNIEMGTIDGYRLAKKSAYDFCISTAMLEMTAETVPFVYVSPVLDEQDFQNVQELSWKMDESAAIYQLELVRIVHDLRDIGCRVEFLGGSPAGEGAELILIEALKDISYRYSLNEQKENCCVFVVDDDGRRILEVHIDMCSYDFMLFSSKLVYLLDNCPDAVIPDFIKFFTEGEANV